MYWGSIQMKCPECGIEMEIGFIITDSSGMIWSEKPLKMIFSGEVIPMKGFPPSLLHLYGNRCTACKLIITRYLEDKQPNNMLQTMILSKR
jgi:hypothetical protein